jgi:hypothetical protein
MREPAAQRVGIGHNLQARTVIASVGLQVLAFTAVTTQLLTPLLCTVSGSIEARRFSLAARNVSGRALHPSPCVA